MRLVGLIPTLLISTGCSNPPSPDLCTIVNFRTAQCTPTSPNKEEYDLRTRDMLGYTCLSPDDQGDVKKYIKDLLRRLD